MKLHRHDYDMEFPYEARPLLAIYVCKHCKDTVLDAATALQKDGRWSTMRSGPGHARIGGKKGAWYVYDTGGHMSYGPYRWRWVAWIMKTIVEDE